MKFKIGIGLLLFGLILANGAGFNIGWILWIVACILGFIGLVFIFTDRKGNEKK